MRDESSMTQGELSAKAGINRSHLCEIEAGKADPRIETLQRIVEALGRSLTDLLNTEGPRVG